MSETTDTHAPQTQSTVIDPRGHEDPRTSAGALDAPAPPPEKPGTVRDAVAKAFDAQDKANAEKPDDKPDPKAVPDRGEGEAEKGDAKSKAEDADAKAKPADADGEAERKGKEPSAKPGEERDTTRQDEQRQEGERRTRPDGRPFYDPPKAFLPQAREAWNNVPNVVKGEIDRITREHEQAVGQYRESHENWTKLSKFDEMARKHNTSIGEALERYTALDGLLQNDPVEAIRQILEVAKITPAQYAKFITENPQAGERRRQPAQPDPAISQTTQEVQELRQQIQDMQQQQLYRDYIEPFRAKHPRYDELEDDIAFFLNSGRIPNSLSPQEKLAAAYDMAERLVPLPRRAAEPETAPAPEPEKPVVDPRGEKSIRGGPSAGFDPAKNGRAKSRRAAIENALLEHGA